MPAPAERVGPVGGGEGVSTSTWHPQMPAEFKNQIVTGDARVLAERIPEASVDLVIADPPYFGIAEGEWDHQWSSIEEWADWCSGWATEMCRALRDNGSAYLFGDDKNIAYMQVRTDRLGWGLLNSLVWSKTNAVSQKASWEAQRSYKMQGEERILFYGKDVRTFAEVVVPMAAAPMAQYIQQERERAGLTRKQLAAFFPSKTGGLTGCVTNWEMGSNFPTPEVYATLRNALNGQGRQPNGQGEYLRQDYEYLRRDYEELRRPFFGGRFTDVWTGPLMPGPQKQHECEKPQWLLRRMILASTKPGAIVLVPFSGSGAAEVAAYQLGRHYVGFELSPEVAEKARQRVADTQPPLFALQAEQAEIAL